MISLFRRSFIYTSGNMLARLISLLLLPLYTYFLSPQDFGTFDLVISVVYFALTVLFLDIHSSTLRFVYLQSTADTPETGPNPQTVLYSSLPILTVSSGAFILITAALHWAIGVQYAVWIVLFGLLNKAVDVFATMARGMSRPIVFTLSHSIHAVILGISSFILIAGLGWTVRALFAAEILAFTAQLCFLEYHCRFIRSFSRRRIDYALTRALLNYTLPFSIQAASYWVLSRFGRIGVSQLLGVHENGLYAAALSLSAGLTILSQNVMYAWQETAFSRGGTDTQKAAFFSTAVRLAIVVISRVYVLMLLAVHLVFPYLIGSTFQAARNLIPLTLGGVLFYTLDLFYSSIYANYLEKCRVVVATVAGAALCLAIMFPMVAQLGVDGANIAIILSFGLSIGIKVRFLRSRVPSRILYTLPEFLPAIAGAFLFLYTSYLWSAVGLVLLFLLSVVPYRHRLREMLRKSAP